MKTLADMKRRLLALPEQRSTRELEQQYSSFLQKTLKSRAKAQEAVKAANSIVDILPDASCARALDRVRRCAFQAGKLRAAITSDTKSIGKNALERNLLQMNEHADSAWTECEQVWQKAIDSKTKDWLPLVEVVAKLVPDQGSRLRTCLSNLTNLRAKCPTSSSDITNAKQYLKILSDVISHLGLETEFGRFLRSVASPQGASLAEAQSPAVQAAIAEHGLERLLRVKLS